MNHKYMLFWTLLIIVYARATNLPGTNRCPRYEFRCASGKCIPKTFRCNAIDECGDNSDETYCNQNTYLCDNNTEIPKSQLCDGIQQCDSDEVVSVCKKNKCMSGQFMCFTVPMLCLDTDAVCNNKPDCNDGSDESPAACEMLRNLRIVHCNNVTHFRCADKSMCVSKNYRCDGSVDCTDKSDEASCNTDKKANAKSDVVTVPEKPPCSAQEFYCGSGSPSGCISKAWVCDNSIDCDVTGLDEKRCSNFRCAAHEPLRCAANDVCYSKEMRCDGHPNCPDGSDEIHCSATNASEVADPSKRVTKCDENTQFRCVKKGICIGVEKLCDKVNDCGDNADERPGGSTVNCKKNMCSNNGECEQLCSNHFIKRICHCRPGYRISPTNSSACEDVDECSTSNNGGCSQLCHNDLPGSFRCACRSGFYLDSAERACLATGEKFLLYSSGNSIREYRLLHHYMEDLLPAADTTRKESLPVGVDYDYRAGRVFFSQLKPVGRVGMLKHGLRHETTLLQGADIAPVGVAHDWLHGLLFVTDIGANTISVINVTSGHHRVLLHLPVTSRLRALVVHPRLRTVFWTDWGNRPSIESMGMDGRNRKSLVSSGLVTPNGLAMDYYQDELYWVDAKTRCISALSLRTGRVRSVVTHLSAYGFALDVFEDWLYLSDWFSHRIIRIHKMTGSQEYLLTSPKPMGLKLRHELAQPLDAENACLGHRCQQLCLPVALAADNHNKYRCACMDSATLLADDVSCSASPDEKASTGESYVARVGLQRQQPGSGLIQQPGHVSLIAGFITGSVLIVLLLAIAAGMLIYRNYMHRVVKQATNFHNPAYFLHRSPTSEILMLSSDRQTEPHPLAVGPHQHRSCGQLTQLLPQDVSPAAEQLLSDKTYSDEGLNITVK